MLNLAFALRPSLGSAPDGPPVGWLRLAARWIRERISYRSAMEELRQLDDRDLDDLNLERADFPGLADRHARGLEPLAPSQLASLRRL
jgi:uncharacterized protein YjiS (DUF1127 family)